MKRFFSIILLLVTVLNLTACARIPSFIGNGKASEYIDLGIPASENYEKGSPALYIYDMEIYDGKLYIGDGDYSANTGPVKVMAYDIAAGSWYVSGTLPDEAVTRFAYIDGQLVIPGTDPTDGWEYGNYYVLNGGEWETVRKIPGGIHNFDMAEFDGMIFAAVGVDAGKYPVACSKDGGQTFELLTLRKDGKPIDTSNVQLNRCHNFITLGDTLYVTYRTYIDGGRDIIFELYEYNPVKHCFDFTTDLIGKIFVRDIAVADFILDSAVFKDVSYMATGYLEYSKDMKEYVPLRFPDDDTVWDVCVNEDELYVLGSYKKEDGTYRITVWDNEKGEPNTFKKTLWFEYDVPAVSFAVDGNDFYFGMSNGMEAHEKNGTVLKATVK
ncbi:MAG: hypothetical protein E7634_03395 [Ruminococcaceae bacterium]|nr:hypothetical protein [Oscillospiraceae bacterium]